MMSPEQEQEQLDALARVIKQRTEAAFEELMTRLQAGEDPRTAMEAVTSQFHGQYYGELSAAFGTVLDRAIGSADIRSLPVSDVALSERLYRHTAEVNAVTRQIIKDHVKGFTQARDLAMQIYEGYGFKDDPLKVQVNLPKYLREALQDPAISQGFAQIVGRIRADNLKTPALKAAYLQAIDALEAGAGGNRLKKLMQTAWFERNRYFANRIAQTELHRAYSNQVAQEIMADEATVWVKYQMSKTHPKVDICDRHAGLNGWGKGPGIYPKAQAPKPPAHPFCRCTVRPAYEVEGEPGKPVKDAEQRFMNRLSDYDQRLIAGSRDRLQQFRDGRSLESIYNEGKNPIYRWGRLGDGVATNWKESGLPSAKQLKERADLFDEPPRLGNGAKNEADALRFLLNELGVQNWQPRTVNTPVGEVVIDPQWLSHIVQKREAARERYAAWIIPTLTNPVEIWQTRHASGDMRTRFIKLFREGGKEMLVSVSLERGNVLWNAVPMPARSLDNQRTGQLLWKGYQ